MIMKILASVSFLKQKYKPAGRVNKVVSVYEKH